VAVPDPNYAGAGPSFIATAAAAGTQIKDSSCASFTVTQQGLHKSVDVNAADSTATCWAGN